jgi:hypothetical protein
MTPDCWSIKTSAASLAENRVFVWFFVLVAVWLLLMDVHGEKHV